MPSQLFLKCVSETEGNKGRGEALCRVFVWWAIDRENPLCIETGEQTDTDTQLLLQEKRFKRHEGRERTHRINTVCPAPILKYLESFAEQTIQVLNE